MSTESNSHEVNTETEIVPVSLHSSADAVGSEPSLIGALNDQEIKTANDIKSAVFDSAELATRSASLAAKAGLEMHQAAQKLMQTSAAQTKINKILLGTFGAFLMIALVLFGVSSYRLQERVSQLDAMVLAVGKRVINMDASVQLFDSVSDVIKDVSQKQDAISNAQAKLEQRIVETIMKSQVVPEVKPTVLDDKSKELLRAVQEINVNISQQASATKSLSAQIQKLQMSNSEAGTLRREMENLTHQMRDRVVTDQAAVVAAPVAAKPRERLVQFPRNSPTGTAPEKP